MTTYETGTERLIISGGRHLKFTCKKCGGRVQVTKTGLVNPCRKCVNISHARGVSEGMKIERDAVAAGIARNMDDKPGDMEVPF